MKNPRPCSSCDRHGRAGEARCPSCASEVGRKRRLDRAGWLGGIALGAALATALFMGCGTAQPISDVRIGAAENDAGPGDPKSAETTRDDERNHERRYDDNTNVMAPP